MAPAAQGQNPWVAAIKAIRLEPWMSTVFRGTGEA
jgi:hypothetical protein